MTKESSEYAFKKARLEAILEKNMPNGVCSLDTGAKVPMSNLPPAVAGGMKYCGVFDASGGIYPASYDMGDYWIINGDGTLGGVDYKIGDWLVCDGVGPDIWDKIDNTEEPINGYFPMGW